MMDRNFRNRAARAGQFAGVVGSAAGLVLVTCTTGWAAPAALATAPASPIHDVATLTGGIAPVTGTITFTLLDATCSAITPAIVEPAVPVTVNGDGIYSSATFTAPTPTTSPTSYHWQAHFHSTNPANTDSDEICDPGDMSETVTVRTSDTHLDTTAFDGRGRGLDCSKRPFIIPTGDGSGPESLGNC
jgi:hypothetical protein